MRSSLLFFCFTLLLITSTYSWYLPKTKVSLSCHHYGLLITYRKKHSFPYPIRNHDYSSHIVSSFQRRKILSSRLFSQHPSTDESIDRLQSSKSLKSSESVLTVSKSNSSSFTENTKNSSSDSSIPSIEETVSLGFSQIQPFLRIAIPYFTEDKDARNQLLQVLALTLASAGVSVLFSYVGRDFYNALNARDEAAFYQQILEFFTAIVIAVPISVAYRFLREKLSLSWREDLTGRVLDQYYNNKTFYIMETMKDIDNPDQRIADDIRAFTRTSLDFLITIITALIDLISFSAILFQIYPGLFGAIVIYAAAGSFVTSKIGFSLVNLNYQRLRKEANFRFNLIRTRENAESIAFYDSNAMLERNGLWKLFKEVYENQMDLIRTQRNLEGFTTAYRYLPNILPSLIVAPLYFAHQVELGAISQSYGAFNHVLNDFSILINQFESLSAFAAGLTRLSSFLDRISLAPLNTTNNSNKSNNQSSPTVYLSGWEKALEFTERSNFIHQLSSRFITLQVIDNSDNNANNSSNNQTYPLEILRVQNLTVTTPDKSRVLIGGKQASYDGIDVSIYEGDRVLIVGPSGAGKSSFLRAISGLWEVGDGIITWRFPQSSKRIGSNLLSINSTLRCNDIMFIPQKPYNFMGTLRDQILYPTLQSTMTANSDSNSDNSTDIISDTYKNYSNQSIESNEYFYDILQFVRLENLCDRVGKGNLSSGLTEVILDWSKVLSLGEQQRLAFARVLYHQPKVIVLDEATSALDVDSERAMYELLGPSRLNATVISVGHRPTLLTYHTKKFTLRGPGIDPIITLLPQDQNRN